ncbi:hypothetical protein D1157_18455 [Anaerotruncus sp. X29]|nr:hypothetical protein [Anaerotruncus sp. X29]
MRHALNIKSTYNSKITILPGESFNIFVWGIDDMILHYAKSGKIFCYNQKLILDKKSGKRMTKNVIVHVYASAKVFKRSLNKLVIATKADDLNDYWDVCIHKGDLFDN